MMCRVDIGIYETDGNFLFEWEMEPKTHTTTGIRWFVTEPTTTLPIYGVCMAERMGCPVFHTL